MLLQNLNFIANALIFIGTAWLVLSKRVPTHSGSAIILGLLNFASLGRMVYSNNCVGGVDLFAVASSMAFCWAFYRVEITKTWGRAGQIGW